jgi:hypothetical protein
VAADPLLQPLASSKRAFPALVTTPNKWLGKPHYIYRTPPAVECYWSPLHEHGGPYGSGPVFVSVVYPESSNAVEDNVTVPEKDKGNESVDTTQKGSLFAVSEPLSVVPGGQISKAKIDSCGGKKHKCGQDGNQVRQPRVHLITCDMCCQAGRISTCIQVH